MANQTLDRVAHGVVPRTGTSIVMAFFIAAILVTRVDGQALASCTMPLPSCTEWLGVPAGPERVLLYRSDPLDAANPGITRAVIVIHGGGRTANLSYTTVSAAAFLAGVLDEAILIAPRFASNRGGGCVDSLAPLEANWGCQDRQPDSWRNGSNAMNSRVTSYDYVDELLRRLARKDVFPDLKQVVIAGHSGGGQFVLRYAMASDVPDKLGLDVTYVVANPDALIYLDQSRPTAAAYPASAAGPIFPVMPPADAFTPFPDVRNCTTFDDWPYGLQKRSGYTARLDNEQMKTQLVSRSVAYLSGGLDVFPAEGFDLTCPAMAQGPTRAARSAAFAKYLNDKFGASQALEVVPTCGHNERCLFTDPVGLRRLFPSSQ